MTEEEFWETTPRAFFNAVKGFESLRTTDLEVQRLQTLYFVNMWAKRPIRDPKKLWVYSHERVELTIGEKKLNERRAVYLLQKIKRFEERHGK